MPVTRMFAVGMLVLLACLEAVAGGALTRAQALRALRDGDAARRVAAIERLAEVGRMADAERLVPHLRDPDPTARRITTPALWMIWSRSGDPAIDRLFDRGVDHLRFGRLDEALAVFDTVVRRKPAFAEGWNKRATVLFMMGRDDESLRDCAKVLERNRHHFGALSGMAQIHLRRGDAMAALRAYERALEVNPNLENGPETLELLEEAVRRGGAVRT